ncbi:hypothetical protein K6U70_00570 [Vibrio vulnificus]|uniref:hypothetical protein n=1 Tax=Vibrio vulnificus TaxID=672 RepID=UPI001EEBC10C|nr:hypothetical protein [Vibrio vulnificus]MCG6270711.1 hypothetical protein [Vibrio vulnificus]
MESLVTGLLGAIVGAIVGHNMTVRLINKKTSLQEQAFYFELEILLDKYKEDLVSKFDDFNHPVKNRYVIGAPVVDMSLINALSIELAGTDKVLNKEVRTLMIHTTKFAENLVNAAKEREKFNEVDAQNTEEFLKLTKQMLIDEVQLVFYLYKLVNDRNNFRFGGYTFLEMASVACDVADIAFDNQIWKAIMPSGSCIQEA